MEAFLHRRRVCSTHEKEEVDLVFAFDGISRIGCFGDVTKLVYQSATVPRLWTSWLDEEWDELLEARVGGSAYKDR